jgi:trans-2,3-dihydro-3-hydroxyanthranilate isomerase
MRPKNPAHTARVRIFFPTAEIPFAGHPTIGCAILLAGAAMDDGDVQIVLEEEAGLVPVIVRSSDGRVTAELTAPVTPHAVAGAEPALDPALLAAAMGLEVAEIGFGNHRPGVWQGGPRFLYVPVHSLETLSKARPCEPAWSQAMATGGVDSAYLYTPGKNAAYQARMFSPTAGIPEDPATGSASAILAAQLWASGAVLPGETRLKLAQGVEMGRPSAIGLTVICDETGVQSVRVSGSAVRISDGHIRIPE